MGAQKQRRLRGSRTNILSRTWLLLSVSLLVAGLGLGSWRLTHQSSQVRANPAQPNVLFILTDDQSMNTMPFMNYLFGSPEGYWVKYPNAFLNTPLCCPSRATLLSGQYSHHTGIEDNTAAVTSKFDEVNTLPVWMKGA